MTSKKKISLKPEIVVVDPILRKTLIMLIDELEKVSSSDTNQEEMLAEAFEKLGLIEVGPDGKLRLTEKGKKLVRMEDVAGEKDRDSGELRFR